MGTAKANHPGHRRRKQTKTMSELKSTKRAQAKLLDKVCGSLCCRAHYLRGSTSCSLENQSGVTFWVKVWFQWPMMTVMTHGLHKSSEYLQALHHHQKRQPPWRLVVPINLVCHDVMNPWIRNSPELHAKESRIPASLSIMEQTQLQFKEKTWTSNHMVNVVNVVRPRRTECRVIASRSTEVGFGQLGTAELWQLLCEAQGWNRKTRTNTNKLWIELDANAQDLTKSQSERI